MNKNLILIGNEKTFDEIIKLGVFSRRIFFVSGVKQLLPILNGDFCKRCVLIGFGDTANIAKKYGEKYCVPWISIEPSSDIVEIKEVWGTPGMTITNDISALISSTKTVVLTDRNKYKAHVEAFISRLLI